MERVRGRRRRRQTNNYHEEEEEEEKEECFANDYVSSSFIPDHLITEILLRTPANSVLRFKSVCKQWCSIIKDPEFIHKHFDYLRKNPLLSYAFLYNGYSFGLRGNYYLKTVEEEEVEEVEVKEGLTLIRVADDKSKVAIHIPVTWFKYRFNTMWQCNGLLCFFSRRRSHILMCNPTTKKTVTLPFRTGNYRPVGTCEFGYDAVNRQYKVVELTAHRNNTVSCDVFTLGDGSKSWRTVSLMVNGSPCSYGPSMHVDGSCYWLIENMADNARTGILCFDVGEEKLRVIKLPYVYKPQSDGRLSDIVMVGGLNERRFGIVNFRTYNAGIVMDIWMLKEDSSPIQDLWIKEYCNIHMSFANPHIVLCT